MGNRASKTDFSIDFKICGILGNQMTKSEVLCIKIIPHAACDLLNYRKLRIVDGPLDFYKVNIVVMLEGSFSFSRTSFSQNWWKKVFPKSENQGALGQDSKYYCWWKNCNREKLVCKRLDMGPDLTQAYFWSAVNKRPTRLWPRYFLTPPDEIFFTWGGKIDDFRW